LATDTKGIQLKIVFFKHLFKGEIIVCFGRREKQLKAEQSLRRQLEEQLDSLLNRRVAGQLDLTATRQVFPDF
jgi:hypothetical protein